MGRNRKSFKTSDGVHTSQIPFLQPCHFPCNMALTLFSKKAQGPLLSSEGQRWSLRTLMPTKPLPFLFPLICGPRFLFQFPCMIKQFPWHWSYYPWLLGIPDSPDQCWPLESRQSSYAQYQAGPCRSNWLLRNPILSNLRFPLHGISISDCLSCTIWISPNSQNQDVLDTVQWAMATSVMELVALWQDQVPIPGLQSQSCPPFHQTIL